MKKTIIQYFLLIVLSSAVGFCSTIVLYFTFSAVLFMIIYYYVLLFTQLMIYLLGRKSLFRGKKKQVLINILFYIVSLFGYIASSVYAFAIACSYVSSIS